MFGQMGVGMMEKGLTNLSEAYGSGKWRREAEYRDKVAYDRDTLANQREDLKQKIALARELGIHPSVMLGSSAASAQLVGMSPSGPPSTQQYYPKEAGPSSAALEQQQAMNKLTLENQELQNDYLALQIADFEASSIARHARNSSPVPPVVMRPDEVTMGRGGVTAGIHPSMNRIQMPSGEILAIPDQNIVETGEVLPIVMQMSQATGIPVNTLYTLASLGVMAIPGVAVARGAYGAYKLYKVAKAAKGAASEAGRLARRSAMRKGGK